MRNGIIRTPLEPRQTFLDDPLRVIRCVRFASRFGFTMVSELEESARDIEIQVHSFPFPDDAPTYLFPVRLRSPKKSPEKG